MIKNDFIEVEKQIEDDEPYIKMEEEDPYDPCDGLDEDVNGPAYGPAYDPELNGVRA